ncbi:MAG: PD-(D/E)XK nuclease family protein [bacterium]|nr:PD-(D/E)XK nuclease family protein [bacterium]
MRTSYSALDTYKQCPQKYKFQEIDRLPAKKSKEAVFGTLLHSTLKFMFDRSPLYPTLDQVLGYYRTRWPKSGESVTGKSGISWASKIEEEAYFDEGIRMLKNFYSQNAPWNFSVVDLESHFEVLIPDAKSGEQHVLAGKIDRIDKLSDGSYEVIDYKTARKLPSQDKVNSDLQLSIYGWGLKKKWPHLAAEQIKLSLYFLKHGEKLSTSRSNEEMGVVENNVLAIIGEIQQKIKTREGFEATPSPLCDWCSYKPICPAWRHLYKKTSASGISQDEVSGVLKEYFELSKNNDAAKKRTQELKQKIREYMEREGYTRVFGEDGSISKSLQKRFSYDFKRVREILEPLGKWQEILEADEKKLKTILKELPLDISAKIEAFKVLTKEFTVLTASTKKTGTPLQLE